MAQTKSLVRGIADTARWAAVYRARETERSDALFRDPLARRLAGERGEEIARVITFSTKHTWSWVTRTVLFDRFISEQIAQGVDMVVNLAAGLDARPYRLEGASAPGLRWVEVDLPEVIDYKESLLAGETPRCALERVRMDLSDVAARRSLFERLGGQATKALILTEGLIIYLTREQVGELARDLAAVPSFQSWVTDLTSPVILRMLQKKMGGPLAAAGHPLQFGPPEGPAFFEPFGWKAADVRPMLKTARRLGRLPLMLRLFSLLPDPKGPPGDKPWSGVCLMTRK